GIEQSRHTPSIAGEGHQPGHLSSSSVRTMRDMRAITFRGIRDVVLQEIAEPSIRDAHDVVVRVQLAAICGSDLHPYLGRETGLDVGTVMGHEFLGEVVAVGSGVAQLRVGDRVVSPFTTNCGACFYCERGLTS